MRCKHVWTQLKFEGDPINDSWGFRVYEQCAKCAKQHDRYATNEEIQTEIARLSCPSCGLLLTDHTGEQQSCLKLLASMVQDLQHRLRSLENWRST